MLVGFWRLALFVAVLATTLAGAWPGMADQRGRALLRVIEGEHQTRYGTLLEVDTTYHYDTMEPGHFHSLEFEGQVLSEAPYLKFSIVNVINWGDKGDVVLVRLWGFCAGNCYSFQIIHVTEKSATLTPEFAEFAQGPSGLEVTPDFVRFRLEQDYPPDVDHLVATFDGRTEVSVAVVPEDDTGIPAAGAGEDVLRWAGEKRCCLFDAPSERQRFRTIMRQDQLTYLRRMVAGSMKFEDGYALSAGCWPHRCNERVGFIAIEVATGRPFAAISNECGFQAFGSAADDLPAPMKGLIEETSEGIRGFNGPNSPCETDQFSP